MARAGFDPASYAGRALLNVLENYPRDELFQIDEDTLYRLRDRHPEPVGAAARARACARRRVRPLRLGARLRAEGPLRHAGAPAHRRVPGRALRGPHLGRLSGLSGRAARAHALHHRPRRGRRRRRSRGRRSRSGIAAIVRTWADALRDALDETDRRRAGACARGALRRRLHAPPIARPSAPSRRSPTSRSSSSSRTARPRAVDLYRREGDDDTRVNLKVFSRGAALPLSERVPLLENLGFRSSTSAPIGSPVGRRARDRVWLHDMTLERAAGGAIDIDAIAGADRGGAPGALPRACRIGRLQPPRARGRARLARRRHGARARRATCARSASPSARTTSPTTLARHGGIAARARRAVLRPLRPARATAERAAAEARDPRPRSRSAAGSVTSLDDDRILRRFVNLVEAAVRTNFFQLDDERPAAPDHRLQVRMRARSKGLPLPRPLYEIFVYSPRVEGVHLRFGQVARGGLRWSDRPQDFRTEVLGLVKAQQVKNAVIVPVGAKGGFVPKHLPPASDRAGLAGGGHRELPHLHRARCSSSPTTSSATRSCRRPTPCATTATIPISWSPPTRARRPSPTSPTRISIETRLLARRRLRLAAAPAATTTRRWASPRGRLGVR